MAKTNILQKAILAAGSVLVALRVVYPVKQKGVGGMRFGLDEGFYQNVDWNTTLLHLGALVVIMVALFLIFKKR